MYEEWFEKLAREKGVEKVNENNNSIELIFNEETTNLIDTEELFMDVISLSRMFRFKAHNKKLIIVLDTIKLEENKIKLLIEMLQIIKHKSNA